MEDHALAKMEEYAKVYISLNRVVWSILRVECKKHIQVLLIQRPQMDV